MRTIVLSLVFIFFSASCHSYPKSVPIGKWEYRLLVNGADIGTATMTNIRDHDTYISTLEMNMDAGTVKNSTRVIVTETTDFKPLKYEVYNQIINNGKTHIVNTIATFHGKKVTVDTGNMKSVVALKKTFFIEGNYYIHALMQKKFKKGSLIAFNIYDPTIEVDETLKVIIRVIGKEDIAVNGHEKSCYHIGYSIENMKNMDIYCDEEGIVQKSVIIMLNNRLELILK